MRFRLLKIPSDSKKLNFDPDTFPDFFFAKYLRINQLTVYLFYAPEIAATLTLPEEESQHCVQVLRAQAGEKILVTDGVGTLYECEITNPHRKHCEVCILHSETPEALHEGYVHVAIAPTKNIDRLEWMIEKTTEMGIDEITPILCEHSERKTVNEERLHKIMIAAAKQSLKTAFPRLNPLTSLNDLFASVREEDRFIAHCMSDEEQSSLQANYRPTEGKEALWHQIRRGKHTLILIGPEGDFSPREVEQALSCGFVPVSLGKARLRTETAGIAACHTAILLNS